MKLAAMKPRDSRLAAIGLLLLVAGDRLFRAAALVVRGAAAPDRQRDGRPARYPEPLRRRDRARSRRCRSAWPRSAPARPPAARSCADGRSERRQRRPDAARGRCGGGSTARRRLRGHPEDAAARAAGQPTASRTARRPSASACVATSSRWRPCCTALEQGTPYLFVGDLSIFRNPVVAQQNRAGAAGGAVHPVRLRASVARARRGGSGADDGRSAMNAADQRQLTPCWWRRRAAGRAARCCCCSASVGACAGMRRGRCHRCRRPATAPTCRSRCRWSSSPWSGRSRCSVPDRKPVAHAADGGGNLGDLELTGVIITPRPAHGAAARQERRPQIRLREGKSLPDGSWTLVEVRPRSAVFDASGGRTELKLPAGAPIDAAEARLGRQRRVSRRPRCHDARPAAWRRNAGYPGWRRPAHDPSATPDPRRGPSSPSPGPHAAVGGRAAQAEHPETSRRARCRGQRRSTLIHVPHAHPASPAHRRAGRRRVWLAGCASLPAPHDDGALQREAMAGTEKPVPAPLPLNNDIKQWQRAPRPQPQISHGSGQFIRPDGAGHAAPGGDGRRRGDLQFREPAGAGGGQGDPRRPAQAELHDRAGRAGQYLVLHLRAGGSQPGAADPGDAAVVDQQCAGQPQRRLRGDAGRRTPWPATWCPAWAPARPAGGLQARLFPLRYISATEMQKLIKPFARKDAVLLVDPARNLLVMSGTPRGAGQLPEHGAHLRRRLAARHVGRRVQPAVRASVTELMPKLDGMFGEHGDTPLAGMLRFIPIERTNALVVISTQPEYLQRSGRLDQPHRSRWRQRAAAVRLRRAQHQGLGPGQVPGADLHRQRRWQQWRQRRQGRSRADQRHAGQCRTTPAAPAWAAPPAASAAAAASAGPAAVGNSGSTRRRLQRRWQRRSARDGGGAGSVGSSVGQRWQQRGSSGAAATSSTAPATAACGSARWTATTSCWCARARRSGRRSRTAIKQLDNVPLQVQIETRILEVSLTGEFQFGVQWYLKGLVGSTTPTATATSSPGPTRPTRAGRAGPGRQRAFGGAAVLLLVPQQQPAGGGAARWRPAATPRPCRRRRWW